MTIRTDIPINPEDPTRKRRVQARLAAAISTILTVMLITHLLWFPMSGRTSPPRIALATTIEAIETARTAGAALWAPHELSAAESLLSLARDEIRRQEVTWLLWRDFDTARTVIENARQQGSLAESLACSRRDRTSEESRNAIERAQTAVGICTGFATLMPLSQAERDLLGKSRRRLAEADLAADAGDLRQSIRLAEEAFALSRDLGARNIRRVDRYLDPATIEGWRRMIDETVRWSRHTGETAIIIVKSARRLMLYDDGRVQFSVRADLGRDPVVDKRRAGDGATPEGRYRIVEKKDRGRSRYYKALLLDYPNEEDRRRFSQSSSGADRGAGLGGLIEIHGEGGRGVDWTRGCIAVANAHIDRLFPQVKVGTPVTIVGSDGSMGRLGSLVAEFEALFGNDNGSAHE